MFQQSSFSGRRVFGLALFVAVAVAAVAPALARATLSKSQDSNVIVITNNWGKFYLAKRCIPNVGGDPNGAGAEIGPGYIYRMDAGNLEVLAPERADRPATGLGTFVADIFRKDDASDGYMGYRTVQGNICRWDNGLAPGLFYSQGAGVSDTGTTLTDDGGSTSTYEWEHFVVHLADEHGVVLFQIEYDWRFYQNIVQLWTRVTECPNGCTNATEPAILSSGDATVPTSNPWIKMPKYIAAVAGGRAAVLHYTSITCRDASGNILERFGPGPGDPDTNGQLDDPQNGSTINNHCDQSSRDYVQFESDGTIPSMKVVARAYPSDNTAFKAGGTAWVPWESPSGCPHGLDAWAAQPDTTECGDGRPHGDPTDPNTQGPVQSDGKPCGAGTLSWQPASRRWEASGDTRTGGGSSYKLATNDSTDAAARDMFFKGWEDGTGPASCPTLYDAFGPAGEKWASYFSFNTP